MFLKFFLPLIIGATSLFANDCCSNNGSNCFSDFTSSLCISDVSANVKFGVLCPESKLVREIYTSAFTTYELELAATFSENWQVWGSVTGLGKKGRSLGFDDKTTLDLIPLALGVKYLFPVACSTKLYIGGGACYSWLKIKDHSDYVRKHTNKEAWGGVAQAGLYYNFDLCCRHAFINLFADYYFQRFHFSSSDDSYYSGYVERHSLNMSGFKGGIGFGLNF